MAVTPILRLHPRTPPPVSCRHICFYLHDVWVYPPRTHHHMPFFRISLQPSRCCNASGCTCSTPYFSSLTHRTTYSPSPQLCVTLHHACACLTHQCRTRLMNEGEEEEEDEKAEAQNQRSALFAHVVRISVFVSGCRGTRLRVDAMSLRELSSSCFAYFSGSEHHLADVSTTAITPIEVTVCNVNQNHLNLVCNVVCGQENVFERIPRSFVR